MTNMIYLFKKLLEVHAKGGSCGNGNEEPIEDKLVNWILEERWGSKDKEINSTTNRNSTTRE